MSSNPSLKSRPVPMEVLVLGLSRAGTSSIKAALEQLGIGPVYHMWELVQNPSHAESWVQALEAKFEGKGTIFTTEQWDNIFGKYKGLSDIPPVAFAEEFITAYPHAKIILNVRDPEAWHKSVMNTLYMAYVDPWFKSSNLILGPSPMGLMFIKSFEATFGGDKFPKSGIRIMEEHNEMVRKLAPKERFLEYDVKEGWGPLCEFLGKEVPETDFPRLNDLQSHNSWWFSFRKTLISSLAEKCKAILESDEHK